MAIQISGTLICSTFGSLFGGIWLDRTLGTTPWLMLMLMVLGIIFTMITVYRIVTESQK